MATTTLPHTDQPYVLGRDDGEHFHFFNHVATRKVSSADGAAMTAVEFVAPRSFGPPLHVHHDEDEIMVVLEGRIEFRTGDADAAPFVGAAGATVFLPCGVAHGFQVTSPTARFVALTAGRTGRPLFTDFVAAMGTATDRPEMPEPVEIDPGEVARVCAEHGIEVLGPPPAPLD